MLKQNGSKVASNKKCGTTHSTDGKDVEFVNKLDSPEKTGEQNGAQRGRSRSRSKVLRCKF